MLARQAAIRGAFPAVSVGLRAPLTFGEWWHGARTVSEHLRERVRPGDPVALPFPAELWPEFCVAYIGCQLAGAIPVPCKARMSPGEWEALVNGCGVTLVVRPEGSTTPLSAAGIPVRHFDDLLRPHPDQLGPATVSATAHVLLTSGTTGTPRAVAASHAELLTGSTLPPAWAGTTLVHSLGPATAAGAEGAMLLALKSGLHATTVAPVRADDLIGKIADTSARIVLLTPAVAMMCIQVGLSGRVADHVKLVMLMGSATPEWTMQELVRYFCGGVVMSHYGATEAGSAQLLMPYDPRRPTAVGRAMGDTEVRIVQDGSLAEPGRAGEVMLRRRSVPQRRYASAPAEPERSAFAEDGWVRTGDLGYLDPNGYLHLLGRQKDIVIRGGQNIAPVEVEAALTAHPDVASAAAFGVPHDLWGEMLVAAVVLRGSNPVGAADLRRFVRSRLDAYKVPSRIVLLDSLPCNESGKVRKDVLRVAYLRRDGPDDRTGELPP
ncbi:class I adenylate-forming enzyme family protein [Dactylosporangium matsuzakiense]|uniref:class I adenylate-forming enzyme family protein n=1 Tax=Dactylosporangium matsuzakiense TaxID=53360 RepID=UPI0022F2C7D6|nr:class I adenylate-forming enzyme family protein [Dactylosporangium matsuzakiense]